MVEVGGREERGRRWGERERERQKEERGRWGERGRRKPCRWRPPLWFHTPHSCPPAHSWCTYRRNTYRRTPAGGAVTVETPTEEHLPGADARCSGRCEEREKKTEKNFL